MANRIFFLSRPSGDLVYEEISIEFKYYPGFALSQKQRSVKDMHDSILKLNPSMKVLEISTKSDNPLGARLSAFNLKYIDNVTGREHPIENVFQSSKVFMNGGPFRDLLNRHPGEAKRDLRLKESGPLIEFNLDGVVWDVEPKSMFYDWIYMSSLYRNESLSKKILEYNAFTDIEFNQEKSINCQARSAAIFVSLCKLGKLEKVLNNKEELKRIYSKGGNDNTQMSLFDL